MSTNYSKSAFESVVGTELNTPTLSTKILYRPAVSVNFEPNATPLERDDELRGTDEPLMVLSDTFAGNWSAEGRLYPDTAGFELKHILGAPTTTVGNGVITDPDGATIPTGGFKHVWTAPFGPSGDAPLTTEEIVAAKDQAVFWRAKGVGCDSLAITNPGTGGTMYTASGPVTYYTRIADPSLTPTYEALTVRPFFQRDFVIATYLGATGVSSDYDVSIANPIEDVDDLSVGPTQHRRGLAKSKEPGPIVFSGTITKRVIDADDWDALMAATGFAVKVRWTSRSIIASAYPYKLFIEHDNAQYVGGGPEPISNSRRIGASFEYKATYDGAGASTTVTLVNATTNYL